MDKNQWAAESSVKLRENVAITNTKIITKLLLNLTAAVRAQSLTLMCIFIPRIVLFLI